MLIKILRSGVWLAIMVLWAGSVVGEARAGSDVHWGYHGETGPEHWASLSPDYRLCRYGLNQSPLDIRKTIHADLGPIEIDYVTRVTSVINNGHTLQLNVEPGSFMRAEGDQFELVQIHFHSPSEHQFKGKRFPLEAHLVHQDEAGEVAVVGVMFRLGAEHRDLKAIGQQASTQIGKSVSVDFDLKELTLHKSHRGYFRYSGSLTTPPCSEGLRWFLLKQTSHISQQQVDNFVKLIGNDARGPQPQGARIVLEH